MNRDRFVLSQLMDFLPRHEFNICVGRYRGNHRVKSFTCLDQFLCMAFAQLTSRESLRDIEICLRAIELLVCFSWGWCALGRVGGSDKWMEWGRMGGFLFDGGLGVGENRGGMTVRQYIMRAQLDGSYQVHDRGAQ